MVNEENLIKIGEIQLSNHVTVSDPCYESGIECASRLNNVKPGTYHCFMEREYASYGHVKHLIVCHSEHLDVMDEYIYASEQEIEVAVDSGTCGIFDTEYYDEYHQDTESEKHMDWYRRFVLDDSHYADSFNFTDDAGVFTDSGYGDGEYQVYVYEVNDEIVRICIEFIDDEDFGDDDVDEWYDDEEF